MIGYISGKVVGLLEHQVIIKTPSGVGYIVACPPNRRYMVNDNLELFTLHVVREDSEGLYGFDSLQDREWVEKLLKVNGVGPKIAALVVYSIGGNNVARAIREEDFKLIATVKGMGAKTAKKIVLELKGAATDISKMEEDNLTDASVTDFTNAMTNMGYKKTDIIDSIKKMKQDKVWDPDNLPTMVRMALRYLS
jgi:holliday junction DNA helicase RuvA